MDFYKLLGIPGELVKVVFNEIYLGPTFLNIERFNEKPDGFPDVDFPLFYGRVIIGDDLISIDGMSGGPIFAFHRNKKGEMKYWLVALQSRWRPKSHIIVACPTKILGHFLEDVLT